MKKLSGCMADRYLFAVDNCQMSGGKCGLQGDGKQIRQSLRHAVVRNKSDPKADACQVQKKIVGAKFNLRHQIKLVLLEHGMYKLAGGTAAAKHQDRVAKQIFKG